MVSSRGWASLKSDRRPYSSAGGGFVGEGSSKKRLVEEAYDFQAPEYDANVGAGIRALTRQLLRDLRIPEAPVALDVACGTGISTLGLAEACGGRGRFVGVDISEGMLRVARESAAARDYDNVEFRRGDAEALEFPDDAFDVVICNMSLQFFHDKQGALREMHRVLRPGGQLGILMGGGPLFREVFEIWEETARAHPEYPGLAAVFSEMRRMHIDLEAVEALLEGAGFGRPWVYARHRIRYADPEWLIHRTPYTGLWKIMVPPEALDGIVDDMMTRFKERTTGKEFKYTWYVILAYCTKAPKT